MAVGRSTALRATCGSRRTSSIEIRARATGLPTGVDVVKNSAQKKGRYGISLEEFEELLRSQGGRCAICPVEVVADGRRLAIDHDHRCCPGTISCGKCIRGILCPNCNRGLGLFQEDLELVKAAAAYLLRASYLIDFPHVRDIGGAVAAGSIGSSQP
ncbi:endonuclease VII domain-containing protein [Paenarthrobacter ilicis]|uniref:endonuclease VII domain-containing protein n=1 Tax=Paenarthrobacter ilicis TaxID=43665 RepID=UPI00386EB75C